MKSFLSVFYLVAALFAIACGTTQPAADPDSNAEALAELLRDVPGISVVGRGEYATVRVRGLKEYQGDGQPLFVANGREILGGFYSLFQAVNADEITSVRVLNHPSETFKYGQMGVNGVVELTLSY